MPHRIRTLLIEDSAFMRIVLSDLLRRDESIQLVATAMNGLDGVIKARTLLPDVIISDMVMPLYDGLFVVEQVMKEASCCNEKIAAYCNEVWKLEEKFDGLELHHVLRHDNLAADFIAKLVLSRDHAPPGVFINDTHVLSIKLAKVPTLAPDVAHPESAAELAVGSRRAP